MVGAAGTRVLRESRPLTIMPMPMAAAVSPALVACGSRIATKTTPEDRDVVECDDPSAVALVDKLLDQRVPADLGDLAGEPDEQACHDQPSNAG